MADSKLSVLIVCLGNICRSPMGEAVLRHVAAERGVDITVDSCGTAGYHIGEEPDDRCVPIFFHNSSSSTDDDRFSTVKTCMRVR
jgi:low molecular weight phosphotyrosine protein phosphatase